jgi:hypothetical protein
MEKLQRDSMRRTSSDSRWNRIQLTSGGLLGALMLFSAALPALAQAPAWSRGVQDLPVGYDECIGRARRALEGEGYVIKSQGGDGSSDYHFGGVKDIHSAIVACDSASNGHVWVNIFVASQSSDGNVPGAERVKLQQRMAGSVTSLLPWIGGDWTDVGGGGTGPASIEQDSSDRNRVVFRNRYGSTTGGRFIDSTTVFEEGWEGGLRGTLENGGNTIRWANGSIWYRGTVSGRGGAGGLCSDSRTQGVMDEWLSAATPPENQRPGWSVRYDSWGRLVGRTPTNTLVGLPQGVDTNLTRCEYLWSIATTLNSTNLGTLKAYVEQRVR